MYLDNLVSVYKNAYDKSPPENIPIRDILDGFKEGKWKNEVENCRRLTGTPRKKAKEELNSVVFSGIRHGRDKNASMTHSGIIIIDFDLDQITRCVTKTPEATREFLNEDKHCAFIAYSTSGVGLKAGFRADAIQTPEEHEQAFDAVVYHLRQHQVFVDPSGVDISRLCFVTYDPTIIIKNDAEPIPWSHIPVRKEVSGTETWEGEADTGIVDEISMFDNETEDIDYGEDGEDIGEAERHNRAQAIQKVLEKRYPKMTDYPWMGDVIEFGASSTLIEVPDGGTRSDYAFRIATNWFRAQGDANSLYAIFNDPSFEISATFFFGPDGTPRNPRNCERQRRRTVGRAISFAKNEQEWLKDVITAVAEPSELEDRYVAEYEEIRDKWEPVLERLANKRKSKVPYPIAVELLRMGVDERLVSETLVLSFPETSPEKIARTVHGAKQTIKEQEIEALSGIEKLNEKHFRIQRYGKDSPVVTMESDGTLTLQTHGKFRDSYGHIPMLSHDGKETVGQGEWWLTHPDSRGYETMRFAPQEEPDSKVYNLWQGFPHEPKKGDTSKIKDYLRNILCGGNEDYFKYLWLWLAHLVQMPYVRPSVAIVLRGDEGVGKSFLAETVCRGLVGSRHYVKEMNPFEKFNAHTQTAIVMFYDEFTMPSKSRGTSMLKDVISGEYRGIERKGFDRISQPNCLHVIIASNEERVLDTNNEARRYFILNVDKREQHKREYFRELSDYLKDGGYEALMYELSGVVGVEEIMRRPPQTEELLQQRELSLTTFEMWWKDILEDGFIEGEEWSTVVLKSRLLDICHAYYDKYKHRDEIPPNNIHLTRGLKKLCKVVSTKESEKPYRRIYKLPILEECRKQFEIATRQEAHIEWDENPTDPSCI